MKARLFFDGTGQTSAVNWSHNLTVSMTHHPTSHGANGSTATFLQFPSTVLLFLLHRGMHPNKNLHHHRHPSPRSKE
jgi:hypothetical protein